MRKQKQEKMPHGLVALNFKRHQPGQSPIAALTAVFGADLWSLRGGFFPNRVDEGHPLSYRTCSATVPGYPPGGQLPSDGPPGGG